ncbi:uncharacterized protein LOC120106643 [Phoenix dactylifera]|uniref:Uncharacterized protein LOC120106643 n=1 Tax=Phoenix dactylifera TaxID=42345 RepID=A0A8B8ZW16_PHODC|nr:uncharacterized protein LOC120106643 [Phoenix dactylifera]
MAYPGFVLAFTHKCFSYQSVILKLPGAQESPISTFKSLVVVGVLVRSPLSRWGESLLMRALSKRRMWVFLFLVVYSLLLSSSWNLLLSIRSWYNSAAASTSSRAAAGWKALYASVLYGGVFGLLSMGAALAVAMPATLVTWITILVLLAFFLA